MTSSSLQLKSQDKIQNVLLGNDLMQSDTMEPNDYDSKLIVLIVQNFDSLKKFYINKRLFSFGHSSLKRHGHGFTQI